MYELAMNEVMTKLSFFYKGNDLKMIRNVIDSVFIDYEVNQKKELPAVQDNDIQYLANAFLAVKMIAGRTERTIQTYKQRIGYFKDWLEGYGIYDISEVSVNHVRRYLAEMEQHNSESYADHSRRVLNGFFQFLEDEGYIQKNPVRKIEKIKAETEIEKPFTNDEVERIRDACKDSREKAIVDLLLSTGIRRAELQGIKDSDIDFEDCSILIRGKGKKVRTVYMSARCKKHMLEYMDERGYGGNDKNFFQGKNKKGLRDNSIYQIVREIGERANVKNCHPHRFRKWFATYMINHNVTIQDLKEMMGHSNIATSEKFYIEANKERIKLIYKQFAA